MITSKHIDANGTVHLWDLGPTKVRMPAIDARHAIETEPDRWALVDPESPDQYRSASEFGGESAGSQRQDLSGFTEATGKQPDANDPSKFGGDGAGEQRVAEHSGADGPAWYPPTAERSDSEKGNG